MDEEARGGTLILGGGFAGSYVARLLKKQGATIVSPENFMLFASMLPEAASGTLEPRHVVVPLRLMCPHATSSSAAPSRTIPSASGSKSRPKKDSSTSPIETWSSHSA